MWALRRVSLPLRKNGFKIGTSQANFSDIELPITYIRDQAGIFESPLLISEKCLCFKRFYCRKTGYANVFLVKRHFSSEVGLEDRVKLVQDTILEDENENESSFSGGGGDCNDDEPSRNEMELSETETDPSEKTPMEKWATSALFEAIVDFPGIAVHAALDKWVAEGNELSREEVFLVMINFRKSRMYERALQFSEWLETSDQFEFDERNYASHLDLIAKVHGLKKAADYLERIPDSNRGELAYRTLLANCVRANNMKKAENVFEKMKDFGFPMSTFSYNQLLILYKRHNRNKVEDLISVMEKENVKPSVFTYKLLIDTRGQLNNITGMEQVLETMKAEGVEPDTQIRFVLARNYISCGLIDKAEAVLKEMEGRELTENRQVCKSLLVLYAELGKADDVERVWKVCKSNLQFGECMAAITAWGKLNRIEEAEAVFDMILKTWKIPSSTHYTLLLKVYADNKLMAKVKDLLKRMADSGCRIGPLSWNAVVKLYVEAGEVEKAASILTKFSQESRKKPLLSTYMAIFKEYAKRGDIHNSENIFDRIRQASYAVQRLHFQTLLQAYINAKAPAYGMRERMKAYKVFPNNDLLQQLRRTDAFRKTAASYLVD
ncbi:Pentatricopeptide repeat [Trema orientale]|uniref:Pentatricopeptide repeat n=1 Tax=Trema orientale TaxID=63057 RepID=A0A2P5BIP0_TREOI|nr:Pentatricopeptide repeat [Trema orientale]